MKTIINTTFFVEKAVEQEFLLWLLQECAAEVRRKFPARIFFVNAPQQKPDVVSYALQAEASSPDDVRLWDALYAKRLRQKTAEKFGAKVLIFTTKLEPLA